MRNLKCQCFRSHCICLCRIFDNELTRLILYSRQRKVVFKSKTNHNQKRRVKPKTKPCIHIFLGSFNLCSTSSL